MTKMPDWFIFRNPPFIPVTNRQLRAYLAALAALLLAMSWVSPVSAIVTATENPNLTKGKITIGLREELGENAAEIERILLENPRVRIGWPSEYEISADPDWPDNFYLIDMNFMAASSTFRQWNQGPDNSAEDVSAPIFVGRLDDGSFVTDLEAELRKIQRRKALRSIRVMPAFRYGAYIDVKYQPVGEYSRAENSTRREVNTPLSLEINVFDGNEVPQFVYILMTKPDNELEWVYVTASDHPINPGEKVFVNFEESGFQFDQAGSYEFLTIASNSPINDGLFASGIAEHIDRSSCSSLLEKLLCEFITDVPDPELPKEIDAGTISGWSTSFNRYYGYNPSVAMMGGGKIAPMGFAPWQVQIYSTVSYTKAQIESDRKLGSKGKYLKDQKPFQLYHRCAGTLISTNIVLTAAHCVAKKPVEGKKVLTAREVLVGTQDLSRGGAKYRIVSVIKHAGYRPGNPKDDIALVRITPKSTKIPPKTIPLTGSVSGFRQTRAGDQVELLGWGYTGMVERGQRTEMLAPGRPQFTEAKLRIGKMEILDPVECRKREGYRNMVVKKLCAESPKSVGDDKAVFSCTRDSGGPVIRWHGNKKVQVGIIVWGVGCGASENGKQNPSLFVDVGQYTDWIERAKRRISQLEWAVEPLP
jgi:hypothetical protein